MKPWPHQVSGAERAVTNLRAHMMHYLAWEERTGKTLTAILTAEMLSVTKVLIVTKKKALEGWQEILEAYPVTKEYTLVNYHQAKKLTDSYDLVLLDESHSYVSGFPKPSTMWREIKKLTKGKPILYMSATPCSQGYALLYHQMQLSCWSPWHSYSTFYNWHRAYGIESLQYLHGRKIQKYDKVQDAAVWACVEHLFDFKTRAELGFEHEPQDCVHYIPLDKETKRIYNTIVNDRVWLFEEGRELVGDTITKVRYALHMLEGGTMKLENDYFTLPNCEKVDFIKERWGDSKDLVIMYQFIEERKKLEEHFKSATILQGTSNAEGVDLSDHKHLVVYSQDYSTARHSQRRARQANKERKEPIIVHYLLTKGAISAEVYNTVAINKKNYIDSLYGGRVL